jgi:PKD repeat protein
MRRARPTWSKRSWRPIQKIVSAPIADAGGSYTANPGEEVTFDASGSFDPEGRIVSYEWDFDGDGTYDVSSPDPTTIHTYAAEFSGQVMLRVTDDAGNRTVAMAPVEIKQSNQPPDCSGVAATPDTLWPPNHKLWLVSLTGATDPDGDGTSITITGVSQDERIDGTGGGDRGPDATDGPSSDQVKLRAERSGAGDGRVYRIAFTVSDVKHATCTGTAPVTVLRDRGEGAAAVDSAPPSYDSFNP